ncbi:hypothetical protein C8A00DRAFT_40203 [Chaetomidium leptoderma]|uniref:UmuC domain-containing protein n=1 Tax=Chaetomidium leptoderma TaxID=669021 RepID=A0AAN7A0F2_9PEZI|nr:hypothetical protein C8A00DRAFT_40203 [Chaetomidium leptoderma]
MDPAPSKKAPRRRDERVILHYCIENRQPSLKALPLGIKQKGILATCNYVARRYGVKKLMPIFEAKKICPDLVLADGEDLSPFRDVSKRLNALLRSYSWNGKIERLGLDEMFLDVTDIVAYNVELLNRNTLHQSYFCLSRSDPEVGFEYDATSFSGCVHGDENARSGENALRMRLLVASHLAHYLRLKIEGEGYTSACGISTNKLLAKLVGDKNKPRNQTTLLALCQEDVLSFMDEHRLRKVPGIGSKITGLLEGVVLGKEPDPNIYTMECIATAGQVRTHPAISPPALERLLSGPGAEKGLGNKVWALLHGVDDNEVQPARDVPTQISIEDSYRGLNEPHEIHRELLAITTSLLRRMHIDLLEDDTTPGSSSSSSRRWLAHPKTIRLTTRPHNPPSGNKPYNWARASRSCPLPGFVFVLDNNPTQTAERLVTETLLPLFYKLHNHHPNPNPNNPHDHPLLDVDPLKSQLQQQQQQQQQLGGGWNIGLINVCVTNMAGVEVAASRRGRDIGDMFRRQEGVLKEFTVYDTPPPIPTHEDEEEDEDEDEDEDDGEGESDTWDHDDTPPEDSGRCPLCDRRIPRFAMSAHERYHSMEEEDL